MRPRFQFSTRRLLLITAVLAVWAAVLRHASQTYSSQTYSSGNAVPPLLAPAAVLVLGVIPILLLAWLAAVIVRELAKKSSIAACCGAAAYVVLVAWAMWF